SGHRRACEIVMIAREDVPFYSPCPLAEYIEGVVSRDQLFLRDEGFYRELDITTMFGREVTRVDAEANEVTLAPSTDSGQGDGKLVAYDRLLIAAGAQAIIPPIPGLTDRKSGIFVLKTLADAEDILGYLNGAQRAVVIGAGFIGLEAAQALARRGLSVTVVEALDRVLPQMLDAEMAALVQARLESNGVQVMLDSPVEAILGPEDGQVTGVVADGQETACELVVCATGVRPNLALVEGTDIAINVGILVDERMETSHPGVFAAGDIVETADIFGRRQVLPTWPNAVSGGRVAGYNLAGVERRFTGLENANVLRVFDLPVVSLGQLNGSETLRRAQNGVVKKLALEGGRVVGLQMVGQVDGAGLFLDLMKKGRDVTEFGGGILAPDFGYGRLLNPATRNGKGYMALRAL
ncbi:MAG: NAD(P)/FAD-dependent oxidoreductase, partial [Anaerolineae bacterium]